MEKNLRLLALAGIAIALIGIFLIIENLGFYTTLCYTFSCPLMLTPLFGFLPTSAANFAILLVGLILLVTVLVLSRGTKSRFKLTGLAAAFLSGIVISLVLMLLLISLMNGQASSSLFAAVVYYAGIPLLVLILCTYMVFRRFANVEKQKRKIMLMVFVSGFLLSWALVFLWDLLSTDISWLI